MSISNQAARIGPYTCTSLPAVLSVTFPYQQASDLLVLNLGQAGAVHDPAVTLLLNSDYTVSGGGYNPVLDMQSGNVTVVAGGANAVQVNDQIVILRNVPVNQLTSFTSTGLLTPKMIERALDKQATLSQQLTAQFDRSLQFENFEFLSPVLYLGDRKNKILGFDNDGLPVYFTPDGVGPFFPGLSGIIVSVPAFDFSAQTPNTALVAGVPAVISLAPVPFGVNGTNVGHHLRIVGGTGETVLITGGTAVSGAASGTVTFTPTYSHAAGTWSIQSATDGLQEALYSLPVGGIVLLGQATTLLYSTATIPPNGMPYILQGSGGGSNYVRRDSSFPIGDLFTISNAGGSSPCIAFKDFTVQNAEGFNNTSGFAFNFTGCTDHLSSMERIYIYNGQNGIKLSGSSYVWMDKVRYIQSATQIANGWGATAGLYVTGLSTACFVNDCVFETQATTSLNALLYGIKIDNADGLTVVGTQLKGNYCVFIHGSGALQITNIDFADCKLDDGITAGVVMDGSTSAVYQNFKFTGCHIVGYNRVGQTSGISLTAVAKIIKFSECNISGWAGDNVTITAGTGIDFTGCSNTDADQADTGNYCWRITGGTNINVSGGVAGALNQSPVTVNSVGFISNGATNVSFTGINMLPVQNTYFGFSGVPTNLVIENNLPQRSTVPTVVSATSIALDVFDTIKISGTTNVQTMTGGWVGRKVTLIVVGGFTFTTGGNIVAAVVKAANTSAQAVFDGTNWTVQ